MLSARQKRIECCLLQGRADRLADLRAVLDDVIAGDASRSGRRRQERREHVHRRRLPGAVWTEKAVDLTRIDPKIDAVHGTRSLPELPHEPARFDAVVEGALHPRTLPVCELPSKNRSERDQRDARLVERRFPCRQTLQTEPRQ